MPTEKHEVLLRLRAIELMAYWEGKLITNRLVDSFGISRQQASSDIKRYLQTYNPKGLIHNPGVKGYVPATDFKPVLTAGHINEYIELLSGLSLTSSDDIFETGNNIASIQLPDRSVRPEVAREVIKACRNNTSLHVLYASMSNPTLHERLISPHTLVYTGFRWHARAYCHTRKAFRDFVLSRIDRIPKQSQETAPKISDDQDWNETLSIALIPNTNLKPEQKALIEKDFSMPEGRLTLRIRKALAHYTLQRYQAALTSQQAELFNEFPVQLLPSDRPKVAPYIFGGDQIV